MEQQTAPLEELVGEQRKLIKKLLTENQRLNKLAQILHNRIQDLEQQHIVIDRSIAEIPFDLDLIPDSDLATINLGK